MRTLLIGIRCCTFFAQLLLCAQLVLAEEIQPAAITAGRTDIPKVERPKTSCFKIHNCEVCSMDANGEVWCSSVGIACQPTEWRCLNTGMGSAQ